MANGRTIAAVMEAWHVVSGSDKATQRLNKETRTCSTCIELCGKTVCRNHKWQYRKDIRSELRGHKYPSANIKVFYVL
jgi:hypothetical protein